MRSSSGCFLQKSARDYTIGWPWSVRGMQIGDGAAALRTDVVIDTETSQRRGS